MKGIVYRGYNYIDYRDLKKGMTQEMALVDAIRNSYKDFVEHYGYRPTDILLRDDEYTERIGRLAKKLNVDIELGTCQPKHFFFGPWLQRRTPKPPIKKYPVL